MNISILGCGNFGEALKSHFLRIGHSVTEEKILDSEIIFIAVPSFAVIDVLENNKDFIKDQKFVICSKGFDGDGLLLSEAILKEFPRINLFFLYGPTLANELKDGVFSSMVLAGLSISDLDLIKKNIESENLRIETSLDVIGVQVSVALKNVMTIFLGIIEGKDLGQNTEAFIFTKGINEIKNFGLKLGAKEETFFSVSCLGDLYLKSRNRLVGNYIGEGQKIEDIVKNKDFPAEGLYALRNAKIIAKNREIEIPIINTLYSIMYEDLDVSIAIKKLNQML
jgi:glycerol-3-phosphate dehydrogenase (NAD(P)+)